LFSTIFFERKKKKRELASKEKTHSKKKLVSRKFVLEVIIYVPKNLF